MNKGQLKLILADLRKERANLLETGRIIEREKTIIWRDLSEGSLVKVIMGARRSGKTVFSHLLLKGKDYGFINFDDERLAFIDREGLNDLLEALYEIYGELNHLLLDEIQNVEGWELFVNRLQRTGIQVFVSKSC